MSTSLYIHVPFCSSRCAYCDFATEKVDPTREATQATFAAYCAAVMRDVSEYAEAGLLGDVPTIYIGGGTPTLLGKRLPALVAELRALPGVSSRTEVSCEANPDSLDDSLVAGLAESGVTRVSLGVQSLDDEVLEWLGRRHDSGQAIAAATSLRDSGLRFSVDLMCGVPVQSAGSWEWTVADAIQTGAGHVSVYPLSVESATPLLARIDAGEVQDTDPDAAADQMLYAAGALRGAGFERYEVASYARPGQECRHNVRYWTGGAYVGIGVGAASMVSAASARAYLGRTLEDTIPVDAARVRFTASSDLSVFLAGPAVTDRVEVEFLSAEETLREDAMLGLRLSEGITIELAEAAGASEKLAELAEAGLVERVAGRWRTTERGWLLGNEVFARVWSEE